MSQLKQNTQHLPTLTGYNTTLSITFETSRDFKALLYSQNRIIVSWMKLKYLTWNFGLKINVYQLLIQSPNLMKNDYAHLRFWQKCLPFKLRKLELNKCSHTNQYTDLLSSVLY